MDTPLVLKRRDLLKLAAASVAAPLLAGCVVAAPREKDAQVTAEEYWGDKNGVRLWIYRKYLPEGIADKPLLFCVHGSSYSGKTMFDLDAPGRDYSVMDHFARLGYDVWTMDHEGYGHSDRSASWSDVASGAADLKVAIDVIVKTTGKNQAALFGQSSGALRAAKFANLYPEHVSRLILGALVYTGEGSRTLEKRRKGLAKLRASNVRKVDYDFFASVFTRDKPGSADADMGELVARAELKYGDTVPNGTYLDMVANLPVCDPRMILCPVLIARGEYDGIASDQDVLDFYEKLPHADKQLAKLGGLAHTSLLGVNRGRLFHVMQAFLTLPAGVPITGGAVSDGDDPG